MGWRRTSVTSDTWLQGSAERGGGALLASASMTDEQPLVIAMVADLLMRSRLEEGLRSAGYRLRVAGGPSRLAEAVAQETPACVLIDLEITGSDPVAVIESLLAGDATKDIPVAAFAGHTREDLLERGRTAGAHPVVARGHAAISTGKIIAAAIASRAI